MQTHSNSATPVLENTLSCRKHPDYFLQHIPLPNLKMPLVCCLTQFLTCLSGEERHASPLSISSEVESVLRPEKEISLRDSRNSINQLFREHLHSKIFYSFSLLTSLNSPKLSKSLVCQDTLSQLMSLHIFIAVCFILTLIT